MAVRALPGAAREHVRVARALTSLPLIEAAFAAGRLSYSKVRALTRIAEPDSEAALLELAVELTASQVERTVRQWRRADILNAGDPPPEARPSFDHWWDESGMLTVKIRMAPEEGTGFMAAIDSVAERTARRERAEATRTAGAPRAAEAPPADDEDGPAPGRLAARRLAALSVLAEAAADIGRRAGDPPRREVVVHVDAAVLADDAAAGRAYVEGGPALTPSVVRRMLCEASVVGMIERDREPLAVGRRKRRATRAQRTALLRRDGGCARPGCLESRVERLHAHHLRHWLFGGRTDLSNLVLLCDRDHGLVHELDLVMSRADGRLVVTAPDGRRVWGVADAAFTGGLPGLSDTSPARDEWAGVHPVDLQMERRPSAADPVATAASRPVRARPGSRRPGRRRDRHNASKRLRPTCPAVPIGATLFPDGEPPLPDAMPTGGERMDVRYVVGVLMGNRDLVRRLETEATGVPAGT